MRRFFWLLIGFFLLGPVAQATHFAGGDCYYDYVSATPGDNTRARYAVHYIFYRDIQGAQFNATSITVGMYDASPTSVAGVAEVLNNAIKIDFWDVDAMADAIFGLLHYPSIARMFTELGADELKKLKWEHVAAKLVTVYDKILAQRA